MLTILYIKGTSIPKQQNPENAFKKAICLTAKMVLDYGTTFNDWPSTEKYILKYPSPENYIDLDLERMPAVFQNKDIIVMNDRYGKFWQIIWHTCDANDPGLRAVDVEVCFSINRNNTIDIMIRQTLPTYTIKKTFDKESTDNINSLYSMVNGISIAAYVEALAHDNEIGIDTGNGINYIQDTVGKTIAPKCLRVQKKRGKLLFGNSNHMPLLVLDSNEAMLGMFLDSTTILSGCAVVAPFLLNDQKAPLNIYLYIAGNKYQYVFEKPSMNAVMLARKIVCMCVMDADRRYRKDNPLLRPMISPTVEGAFSGKIATHYEHKISKLSNKLQVTESALESANKKIKEANIALSRKSSASAHAFAAGSNEGTEELREMRGTIKMLRADLTAKNAIIAQQQKDYKALQKRASERELQQQAIINHLINKLGRPNKFSKIADWVRDTFAGRLELTAKAEKMLNVTDLSIDIDILCDTIEYLATEYLDYLKNEISQDEMVELMALKYNRPFSVTPISDAMIVGYPESYTTTYVPANNKPETRGLDLHLKYGVNPETLIRIYFFYEEKEKKIVIGSLPKHL